MKVESYFREIILPKNLFRGKFWRTVANDVADTRTSGKIV